jgi:hypothetical protein
VQVSTLVERLTWSVFDPNEVSAGPAGPCGPVPPVAPGEPVAPVAPAAPVAPPAPAGPAGPAGPVSLKEMTASWSMRFGVPLAVTL